MIVLMPEVFIANLHDCTLLNLSKTTSLSISEDEDSFSNFVQIRDSYLLPLLKIKLLKTRRNKEEPFPLISCLTASHSERGMDKK